MGKLFTEYLRTFKDKFLHHSTLSIQSFLNVLHLKVNKKLIVQGCFHWVSND